MAWQSAGVQTNPVADTILADSGAIAAGGTFSVTMGCVTSVPATVALELRDAANTTTLNSMSFNILDISKLTDLVQFSITVAANQRLRIRLVNAITGQIQGHFIV